MAQIENGISSKQYLLEGALIMQDVNHLIDNLKDGNTTTMLVRPRNRSHQMLLSSINLPKPNQ
jgi:hypothetical protein